MCKFDWFLKLCSIVVSLGVLLPIVPRALVTIEELACRNYDGSVFFVCGACAVNVYNYLFDLLDLLCVCVRAFSSVSAVSFQLAIQVTHAYTPSNIYETRCTSLVTQDKPTKTNVFVCCVVRPMPGCTQCRAVRACVCVRVYVYVCTRCLNCSSLFPQNPIRVRCSICF